MSHVVTHKSPCPWPKCSAHHPLLTLNLQSKQVIQAVVNQADVLENLYVRQLKEPIVSQVALFVHVHGLMVYVVLFV